MIAWLDAPASKLRLWPLLIYLTLSALWATGAYCMTDDEIGVLRQDTRNLFYHGYSNYLAHAFPEDELKPLSCKPQTRNYENPADIGLNDVLGNYSLTLIDSLSTLAILASGEDEVGGRDALQDFQDGVASLVELYGDGNKGSCGSRSCAFNLDSKVQVFETNIRGVGGLLSAHLFATGELPIRGYKPQWTEDHEGTLVIAWNGFTYDGQLLRLAYDLASRLLPAFSTASGMPYPRVNLRHGIPFYQDAEEGVCRLDGKSKDPREITETCAAGAGSLVLEFTTLSRLSGDNRFERLAKQAFWSVWRRRSSIGLLGNGIDAESGQWTMPPLSGIGAGIDSFFEYALKSHILLSNLPYDTDNDATESPEAYLRTWQQAHAAVRRHVYRSPRAEVHPFYGQADLNSGAPRYSWIDNLSAYYPGLLALAGELDEAIESHLLFSALWTRYGALPERWHASNAYIDPNFRHWAGRPEFIESTWYLYRSTRDPWYLHVGEMTLRDIRRRCWTKCGWTDLSDVISGEKRDRMESFFLGETAKYLFLLFSDDHPLNQLDASFVFSTEGHPLIVPESSKEMPGMNKRPRTRPQPASTATCPRPPSPLPLTVSNIANRADLFHAAALAQLHLVPVNPVRSSYLLQNLPDRPGVSMQDVQSPTNYTFYPWTLPLSLTPVKGTSSPITNHLVSTLSFPNFDANNPATERGLLPMGALQKALDGIIINSLSNLKLSLVQEPKSLLLPDGAGIMVEEEIGQQFRVHGIANWALGRDEKVLLSQDALHGVHPNDPHFTRVKDLEMCDLVIDITPLNDEHSHSEAPENIDEVFDPILDQVPDAAAFGGASGNGTVTSKNTLARFMIPAILPTGPGAAPLPASMDASDPTMLPLGSLPYRAIYYLDSTLCDQRLPAHISKRYQILVITRGECSFNDKLANIPAFAPDETSLQLVVVVSSTPASGKKANGNSLPDMSSELIRPLLDEKQRTASGFDRRHPIAMVMIDAGDLGAGRADEGLKAAASALATFDEKGNLVEEPRGDRASRMQGIGVRRRYWFESMGVPIANLILL
ncbi:hypothetical protein MBLNU230_g7429t1 [Neophaeotheca triangularis]